ncbi:MAG: hypothetical protein QOH26_639, partial [Actinomycetota bacterium]|nr:hypothetical protein [Actinomycetota bacterium]
MKGQSDTSSPLPVIAPERLGYLQALRGIFVALVLFSGRYASRSIGVDLEELLPACLAYAGPLLLTEILRRAGKLSRLVVGIMLVVDALFLAWVTYVSGGLDSPLRFLIYTHLVAVTLLTSHRTGLKIALLHLVLLFATFQAQIIGILPPEGSLATAIRQDLSVYQPLLLGALSLVLVAMGTAPFSSLNERELRRRKGDLEILARLTEELENAEGGDHVARTLLETVCETFGFERGAVLAGNDEHLFLMAALEGRRPAENVLNVDRIVLQAWRKRDTLLVDRLDPVLDGSLTAMFPGATNLLVVP